MGARARRRARALLLSAAIGCGLLAGGAGAALAGHPLGTEDAGTQGKGNVEVEFNLDRRHDGDGTRTTSLGNTLTMGISPKIDLFVGYVYDFAQAADGSRSRAMGPVEASLKAALVEGKERVPTLGVKAGFSLPAAEGEQAALLAAAIAEWSFEPLVLFANVGADFGTHLAGNADASTAIRASLAGSCEVRKEWSVLSELLWEKKASPSASPSTEWLIGAEKGFTETFSVNAGARWGLNSHSPHVTYLLGFTLGFRGQHPAPDAEGPAHSR